MSNDKSTKRLVIVYDLSDFLIPENVSLLKEYYKTCTLKLLSSSLTQWNVKYWSYNFNDSRGRIGKISSELKKQLLSILNTTKDKKIDTIGAFSYINEENYNQFCDVLDDVVEAFIEYERIRKDSICPKSIHEFEKEIESLKGKIEKCQYLNKRKEYERQLNESIALYTKQKTLFNSIEDKNNTQLYLFKRTIMDLNTNSDIFSTTEIEATIVYFFTQLPRTKSELYSYCYQYKEEPELIDESTIKLSSLQSDIYSVLSSLRNLNYIYYLSPPLLSTSILKNSNAMETLYEHYSLYQQFCSFSLRLTVFSLAEVLFLPFYFDTRSFFMKSFTPTTRLSSSGTNILSNDLQDSYYLVSFQFSSLTPQPCYLCCLYNSSLLSSTINTTTRNDSLLNTSTTSTQSNDSEFKNSIVFSIEAFIPLSSVLSSLLFYPYIYILLLPESSNSLYLISQLYDRESSLLLKMTMNSTTNLFITLPFLSSCLLVFSYEPLPLSLLKQVSSKIVLKHLQTYIKDNNYESSFSIQYPQQEDYMRFNAHMIYPKDPSSFPTSSTIQNKQYQQLLKKWKQSFEDSTNMINLSLTEEEILSSTNTKEIEDEVKTENPVLQTFTDIHLYEETINQYFKDQYETILKDIEQSPIEFVRCIQTFTHYYQMIHFEQYDYDYLLIKNLPSLYLDDLSLINKYDLNKEARANKRFQLYRCREYQLQILIRLYVASITRNSDTDNIIDPIPKQQYEFISRLCSSLTIYMSILSSNIQSFFSEFVSIFLPSIPKTLYQLYQSFEITIPKELKDCLFQKKTTMKPESSSPRRDSLSSIKSSSSSTKEVKNKYTIDYSSSLPTSQQRLSLIKKDQQQIISDQSLPSSSLLNNMNGRDTNISKKRAINDMHYFTESFVQPSLYYNAITTKQPKKQKSRPSKVQSLLSSYILLSIYSIHRLPEE